LVAWGRLPILLGWGVLLSALPGIDDARAEQKTGLSMYVQRKLASVWPWDPERRTDAFQTVTKIAEALWHTDSYGAEIATARTGTFPGYPLLVLTDEDGNGTADFYAYYDESRSEDTMEFGAFFAEQGKARPFWLLFNGGPSLEMTASGEMVFFWLNHQFIDRNSDGAFDTYIVNDVDFDGNGQASASDTAWMYDDDADGLLDRAELIIDGRVQTIAPENGILDLRRLGGPQHQPSRVGDPLFAFPDAVADDIQAALSKGENE